MIRRNKIYSRSGLIIESEQTGEGKNNQFILVDWKEG